MVEKARPERAEDHRRHVHLHRRRDRPRRRDAAVGARRRLRSGLQTAQRSDTRKKIAQAIMTPTNDWENLFLAAGSPDRVLLVEFKSEALKPLTGKTLAEVAKTARRDPDRHDHEPGARRSPARRHRLFHDVGGQHQEADRAAVGVVRIGRRLDGAGSAVHSSRRRTRAPTATSRGCSDNTSGTRKSSRSRRRSAACRAARHESRARSPRLPPRRHVRRRRRLRSRRRSPTAPRSRSRTSMPSA